MYLSHRAQQCARLAVLPGLVGTTILACSTPSQPAASTDDAWAEQTTVSVSVHTELQLMDGAKPLPGGAASRRSDLRLPLIRSAARPALLARGGGGGVTLKHVREQDGAVITMGAVFDAPDRPPKRLYIFKNGVIQFVYSPRFNRRGNGWELRDARAMAFDERGRPFALLKTTAEPNAPPIRSTTAGAAANVAADAVETFGRLALPAPSYATESEGGCFMKYARFVTAQLAVLGAGVGAAVVLEKCPTLRAACVAALIGIAVAGLKAVDELILAAQALIACDLEQAKAPGGGHTLRPDYETKPDNTSVWPMGDQAFLEFIAEAERRGALYCSGDACVPFAE